MVAENARGRGNGGKVTDAHWPWPGAGGGISERVAMALEEVRPALRRDGGDVELVEIDGATVRLRLTGACRGCPMAPATLVDFVEERIRLYAPEIEAVVSV